MFIAIVIIVINGIILNAVNQAEALIALPTVEDNDILKAGGIIKNTTNQLFSTLKFRGKKGNPNLKRLSLIHSYLVTLALQDHSSLTEIAKLTRVDKKSNSEVDEHFIKIINESLEDNASGVKMNEKDEEEDNIVDYVTNYMHNLDYMTHFYSTHNPKLDLNTGIMEYFENKVKDNSTAIQPEKGDLMEGLSVWKPDLNTRRIYGGKRTKIKKFPFMASIEIFDKFTCGGSIIHDDLVLTAASCLQLAWNNRFYRENPAFLSVRIGSTFFQSGGEKVEVLEVYFHPSYDPGTLHDNLAIIRLLRKIRFSKSNRKKVMKIEFDTNDHSLPNTAGAIYIIGWGAMTSSNKIHSPWEQRLSFDTLGIYGLDECQDVYSKDYVTRKHFCAGYMSKGGGACNRDVGGPGVIDGILTGVISFGSPVCGARDSPTVFTKVGFYADWIEDIIEQEVPMARKRTTTERSFDPKYDYKHTKKVEGKLQLFQLSKTTTTESSLEEETTTEKQGEASEDKNEILREEKEQASTSDTDNDKLRVLGTKKDKKEQSQIVEAATEKILFRSTALNNMDPHESFTGYSSDSESLEIPVKVSNMSVNSKEKLRLSNDAKIESSSQPAITKDGTNEIQQKLLGNSSNTKLTEKPAHKIERQEISEKQTAVGTQIKVPKTKPTEADKSDAKEQLYDEYEYRESKKLIKRNKNPLKSDDVILTLLYASDDEKDTSGDESTDEENKRAFFSKARVESEESTSQSEDYDLDVGGLIINKNANRLSYRNRNDTTLQSILTNQDIYEILTEALRENLNFSLPVSTKTPPRHRSKRAEI